MTSVTLPFCHRGMGAGGFIRLLDRLMAGGTERPCFIVFSE